MLEPLGHMTALAIFVVTHFALRISPDACLVALLADHVVLNEAAVEGRKSEVQIYANPNPKVSRNLRLMVSAPPGYEPFLQVIRTRSLGRLRNIPSRPVSHSH